MQKARGVCSGLFLLSDIVKEPDGHYYRLAIDS